MCRSHQMLYTQHYCYEYELFMQVYITFLNEMAMSEFREC
jgi:hypothetical protein